MALLDIKLPHNTSQYHLSKEADKRAYIRLRTAGTSLRRSVDFFLPHELFLKMPASQA